MRQTRRGRQGEPYWVLRLNMYMHKQAHTYAGSPTVQECHWEAKPLHWSPAQAQGYNTHNCSSDLNYATATGSTSQT